MGAAAQLEGVNVVCKANVYFDGGVVSHTVWMKDGSRKTIGIIRPGKYKFDTGAAELMEIISGTCKVKLPGAAKPKTFKAGTKFKVPEKSSFEISVEKGLGEYVCSFL